MFRLLVSAASRCRTDSLCLLLTKSVVASPGFGSINAFEGLNQLSRAYAKKAVNDVSSITLPCSVHLDEQCCYVSQGPPFKEIFDFTWSTIEDKTNFHDSGVQSEE